jgi:glycerophosphoryl diester phosphodiesterase
VQPELIALSMIAALGMAAPRIAVHGHRGARAVFPENTLAAFRHALQAGADFLELDVAVTRDDVLVVSHDPGLNPQICTAPPGSRVIRELTLAELRAWDCGSLKHPQFPKQTPVPGSRVPTLDEVLELGQGNSIQFNVETKIFPDKPHYTPSPERFAGLLLEAIDRHKMRARVVVQSFDFRTLHAMKRLAPEIRLSALCQSGDRDFVSLAREAGAGIISPQYKLVTVEKVRAAHAVGLEVIPWTANTPEEWDKLIRAGVDAIITDDPAELIRYLTSRKLR